MNEKQRQIIMKLAGDPALLEEFLKMTKSLEEKVEPSASTVSLYAVCRHTDDGKEYYHPVVAPTNMSPEPEDYVMISDKNVVTLQKKYKMQINMMESMTGEHPVIITIPESKYIELENQLTALIGAIYEKIDAAYNAASDALEGISELTGTEIVPDSLKSMLVSQIVGKMTISGKCLNEDYEVEDAHDYVEDEYDDDDYDDDDYEDDDYCDEDCDDCCCAYRKEEDACCEDCSDLGDCPCTR